MGLDSTFDKLFAKEGDLIGGVDESGTSDIAGPLVAACVILPPINIRRDDLRILEVDDSKEVHKKWRKQHAQVIWQTAVGVGIGEVSPTEYDLLPRQDAICLAMFRAVMACRTPSTKKPVRPDFLIVDGDFPVSIGIRQATLRDADARSLCTASASIVAKVYRDEIMVKLHERFPYYDWINNKGFPSEAHLRGLDRHGVQPGIHRVRKWPFTVGPDAKEDNPVMWRKRRRHWCRTTLENLSRDVGGALWTSKPPLWNPSPSFRHQLLLEAKSGKDMRSSRGQPSERPTRPG